MKINQLYEIVKTNPDYFNQILDKFEVDRNNITASCNKWDIVGGDLDFIEVIMKLEILYNIQISDNLMEEIESIGIHEFYTKVNISMIREDKLKSIGL